MSWIDSAARGIIIATVALLMIPAGFGLMGCTLCAFSSGFNASDRIGFVIWALVCLGILVGGFFAIGKLGKKQAGS